MPRLAANLSMLFTEEPFLERFPSAAAAGFRGVECRFPYRFNINELSTRLRDHGLEQVLFNLPAGDWAHGERGIACDPDRMGEFREGVVLGIEYAGALGCSRLNCLAGIIPAGVSPVLARETLVENLRYASTELGQAGIRLMLEPINTRDVPGFLVCRSAGAREIIEQVGTGNLWLQYDVYHMQVMEGDLARGLERSLPVLGHVQIADNPGRHEPGSGEISFGFLLRQLDALGYTGWVGCEYRPAGSTAAGLAWAQPWLGGA